MTKVTTKALQKTTHLEIRAMGDLSTELAGKSYQREAGS
jgi:hypothetical protein